MATITTPEASEGTKQNNVCGDCEGSGANIICKGECGRAFHDACTGVTLAEATSKGWRCRRCVKISVVSHSIQNEVQCIRDGGSFFIWRCPRTCATERWYFMVPCRLAFVIGSATCFIGCPTMVCYLLSVTGVQQYRVQYRCPFIILSIVTARDPLIRSSGVTLSRKCVREVSWGTCSFCSVARDLFFFTT